jgi:hypothetical protein
MPTFRRPRGENLSTSGPRGENLSTSGRWHSLDSISQQQLAGQIRNQVPI